MKLSGSKYDLMSALFILAGAVMFFLAIGQSHGSDNIQRTASTMSRVLDGRLDLLEEYMDRVFRLFDVNVRVRNKEVLFGIDISAIPADIAVRLLHIFQLFAVAGIAIHRTVSPRTVFSI